MKKIWTFYGYMLNSVRAVTSMTQGLVFLSEHPCVANSESGQIFLFTVGDFGSIAYIFFAVSVW